MNIDEIVKQVIADLESSGVGQPVTAAPATAPVQAARPAAPVAADPGLNLAAHIEHALLIPDITFDGIREACALARKYCIAAVNVAPYHVATAAEALRGSTVLVSSAVGIPNAFLSKAGKVSDIKDCISNGADEIDVVINNLAIKSGRMDDARREMDEILEAARGKAVIKASFEHCLFDEREKTETLKMLASCGIEFLKIQNVLSGKGADEEDIRFAADVLGRNVRIKIDGGVKTAQRLREIIAAGASRVGMSATFSVLGEK